MLDILCSIADKLLDLALDPLFNALSGGISSGLGSIFGSFGGGAMPTVPSFSGGGYTGNGPRTGGVDGHGGMMAIVHPNETNIDHHKVGGGSSGGVTIVNHNYFNGVTREEVMADVAQSQTALKQQIDNEFPNNARKYTFARSRGMA